MVCVIYIKPTLTAPEWKLIEFCRIYWNFRATKFGLRNLYQANFNRPKLDDLKRFFGDKVWFNVIFIKPTLTAPEWKLMEFCRIYWNFRATKFGLHNLYQANFNRPQLDDLKRFFGDKVWFNVIFIKPTLAAPEWKLMEFCRIYWNFRVTKFGLRNLYQANFSRPQLDDLKRFFGDKVWFNVIFIIKIVKVLCF